MDPTLQVLLLRQLYLAQMEERRFEAARATAERMLPASVMPDVVRQDVARACLAQGDVNAAVQQLRLASRVGPASRRAFHLWTLGTVLAFTGALAEAERVLARAVRWAGGERPLYQAQRALVRRARGLGGDDLESLLLDLEESPAGQGYGQYVRAELAHALGKEEEARRLLRAFVQRVTSGRAALEVALAFEVRRARELLRSTAPTRAEREP